MKRAHLLLLVACAKPAPPSPVLGNQRAEIPEEKVPPNCEMPARMTLRVRGTMVRVALFECLVRERADNEEQKEAGFVMRDRAAELVWSPPGEKAQHLTIREWTDGWEWGGSVYMVGVLSASNGIDDALVIQENSWDTGVGSQRAVIYAPQGESWRRIDEMTGEKFELSKDGRVLHVEQCDFLPSTAQTPDVVCDATTGTVTRFALRWDGTVITRVP